MQRTLIIIGALILAIGIFWPFLKGLGLGSLPGDVNIKKDGFSFHFPIVTCLIVSVVLSLLFRWFK